MTLIPDPLEADFRGLSNNDFIVSVYHIADKQEKHEAFQGDLPEYVTKAAQLREHAGQMEQTRDAIDAGDESKKPELKIQRDVGQRKLSMNARHLTMLSLHRNNPNLLIGGGYESKQKSTSKPMPDLLDTFPWVSAKHLDGIPGGITIIIKRPKNTAATEVQITDQDPSIESSWPPGGIHMKSRIEQRGLEPTKRVHIRARYHKDGKTGPWSAVTSIIVL